MRQTLLGSRPRPKFPVFEVPLKNTQNGHRRAPMENDAFHGEFPQDGYRTVARRTSSRSSRLFFRGIYAYYSV